MTTQTDRTEIVFIDTSLTDWWVLAESVPAGAVLLELDASRDGLQQITEELREYGPVDAIHILTHGGPATLRLGNTVLDPANLDEHAAALSDIGELLTTSADILLYGCNIGSGDAGQEFVTRLSQLTGADIAASIDATGAPALGGDGDLELTTGPIEAAAIDVTNYGSLLATNTAPAFPVGDGHILTPIGNSQDIAYGCTLQPDGKLVVVGATFDPKSPTGWDMVLARYNADGSLDSSFDGDGWLATSVGSSSDYGRAVAVQPDGKILLGGYGNTGTTQFALLRYNSDGTLDTTFSGDGKVTTDFGIGHEYAYSITLQSDGKILLAGQSGASFAVARYTADGGLDSTFGGDGTIDGPAGSGQAIAVQADGKILVGGNATGSSNQDFAIVRYLTNGSLDTSFGGDGQVLTPIAFSHDYGKTIAVQTDGKILVAGYADASIFNDFAVVRYNADGTLDSTFSGDGIVVTNIGSTHDQAYSMVLQSDGKILVGGYRNDGGTNEFAVVRYNTDGSLDTAFSGDGIAVGPAGQGYGLALRPDGKVILVGTSATSQDFALARFNPDGSLDTTFDSYLLNGNPTFVEGGSPVVLDTDVQIADADLDALNGGAGDYHGASLTIVRNGGPNVEDAFGFVDGNGITLSGDQLLKSGQAIATFDVTNPPGQLTVTFTNANGQTPTSADVDAILRQVTYSNSSDLPPSSVQLDWTFSDGNAGAQGIGGALSASGSTTVDLQATNDAPTGENSTIAATEDVSYGFNRADLPFRDADRVDEFQAVRVETLPTSGSLTLSGATIAPGTVVTAAQIDAGSLRFLPAADQSGVSYASFTFRVSDGVAWSDDAYVATIDVLPANDDPSFMVGDGAVTTSIGSYNDTAHCVALMLDGRIVVGGTGGGAGPVMIRYHTDGSSSGILASDVGGLSVAVQTDGKILFAGTGEAGGYDGFGLARFGWDGLLDTTFDGDGKAATVLQYHYDAAYGIAVQSDGKIVLAGHSQSASYWDFGLVRYNADGSLDTTFSSDGIVTTSVVNEDDYAYAVAIQSDGKILVAGDAYIYGSGSSDVALVRYNTDGSLDTTFDGDGKVLTPVGTSWDQARSIVVQPDGKILVGGSAVVGDAWNLMLARYNADGSLDTTFDGDGKVTTAFTADAKGSSVALQADGKIVVAGLAYNGSNNDFAVARYSADGSLDTTFDGDGKITTAVGSLNDVGASVVVQPDGRIVVAGTTHNGNDTDFAVVRYDPDGRLDDTFGAVRTLGEGPSYIENGAPVVLDPDVDVLDADLDALNGGLGDYHGAYLTVHRNSQPAAEDFFSFVDGNGYTLSDSELLKNSQAIATFDVTTVPGQLTITFTHANNEIPTSADVDAILRQIAYASSDDAPSVQVQIDWWFNDGNTGDQGSGGARSDGGHTEVSITAINDAPVAVDSSFELDEDLTLRGNALGTDADLEYPTFAKAVEPAHGSLELGESGNFKYIPAPDFYGEDSFTFTVTDAQGVSDTGSVTITISPVGDTVHGTPGNDALTGDPTADALYGEGGNDTLNGLGGADLLVGGLGDDTYYVDDAGDTVTENAGEGDDRVFSSITLTAPDFVERLRLLGTADLDGTGNGLENILYPNAGNNVIHGGAGSDAVDYFYATSAVTVSLALAGPQATGGSGTDTLTSIENLTGSNHDDTLTGTDYNNAINGRQGADTMAGLKGNDTYLVDNAGDVVQESVDAGLDRIKTYVTYTLPANVERLQLLGTAAIDGTGNTDDNILYPNGGSNVIDGGAGTDTVDYYYATGAVTVSLALATPQATGGSATDTLVSIEKVTGSNYADTLTGSDAANVIDGRLGADTMAGGGGNDDYYVDSVADVVQESGGGGTDRILSSVTYTLPDQVERLRLIGTDAIDGTGNDLNNYVWAGMGNNRLDGGAGTDTVDFYYSSGAVTVSLAIAAAQVTGGSGSDTLLSFENLTGSNYADTLIGNDANNVINGRFGSDSLTGGLGNDIFTFTTQLGASNVDTITDFSVVDDTIRLDDAVFSALATGTLAADAFVIGTGAADALDRIIYDDSTGALYYDGDGDGSGSATQFATVNTGLAMTAADFVVV